MRGNLCMIGNQNSESEKIQKEILQVRTIRILKEMRIEV